MECSIQANPSQALHKLKVLGTPSWIIWDGNRDSYGHGINILNREEKMSRMLKKKKNWNNFSYVVHQTWIRGSFGSQNLKAHSKLSQHCWAEQTNSCVESAALGFHQRAVNANNCLKYLDSLNIFQGDTAPMSGLNENYVSVKILSVCMWKCQI